jgi:aminomethyltransferase
MTLLQTPLHDWHATHGGRLVDFAGWSMPVQYGSIVQEHHATRKAAGLFDVSHMGRLRLDGAGAGQFLDRLLTRKVVDASPGRIRYSLMCKEDGGILDDVLAYHLTDADGNSYRFLVVNASNREKIVGWLKEQLRPDDQTNISDVTRETAMIAVQGPKAFELTRPLVDAAVEGLSYYTGQEADITGIGGIVSRTGYTGEDGCELIVPASAAVELWDKLLSIGAPHGATAVGLAARDTLRLEAAMPLYGHELSETIDPLTAGLDFAVNLKGREFVGSGVLRALADQPRKLVRIGLQLASKRVPREHYPVLAGETRIGEVTSGTFSPTLERPIAMAYVPPQHSAPGTELNIDIRGKFEPAVVVELPFYKRSH